MISSVLPLNSNTSSTIATDKAAAATILAQCGVPCVPHELVTSPLAHIQGFEKLAKARSQHGTLQPLVEMLRNWPTLGLVLKPKSGYCGKDTVRARSMLQLEAAFMSLLQHERDFVAGRFFFVLLASMLWNFHAKRVRVRAWRVHDFVRPLYAPTLLLQ